MSVGPITDEIITIPVADAQIIRAALNSAYHQNTVLDLAEQYRKLHQRPQASKLTQALQNALTLLIHYLTLGEPEEEAEEAADES